MATPVSVRIAPPATAPSDVAVATTVESVTVTKPLNDAIAPPNARPPGLPSAAPVNVERVTVTSPLAKIAPPRAMPPVVLDAAPPSRCESVMVDRARRAHGTALGRIRGQGPTGHRDGRQQRRPGARVVEDPAGPASAIDGRPVPVDRERGGPGGRVGELASGDRDRESGRDLDHAVGVGRPARRRSA